MKELIEKINELPKGRMMITTADGIQHRIHTDDLIALAARAERYRVALERYADEGMWEYTYSKRLGGSCGDIVCPHHRCTKSELMSKYDGWQIAQAALNAEEHDD